MRLHEAMSMHPWTVTPDQSLAAVAELMRVQQVGFLPVVHHGRLVGAVTDRDLLVRGLARGLLPTTPVSEVMSEQVVYAFEDESVEEGLRRMEQEGVRRLLIVGRKMELLGVATQGDLVGIPEVGEVPPALPVH